MLNEEGNKKMLEEFFILRKKMINLVKKENELIEEGILKNDDYDAFGKFVSYSLVCEYSEFDEEFVTEEEYKGYVNKELKNYSEGVRKELEKVVGEVYEVELIKLPGDLEKLRKNI